VDKAFASYYKTCYNKNKKEDIMKKFLCSIIVVITLFVLQFSVGLHAKSKHFDEFAYDYFSIMQNFNEEWNEAQIKNVVELSLGNNGESAYLYRVYRQNIQNGYFVVMSLNNEIQVVEATFVGEDPVKQNSSINYYVAPFGYYTKKEYENFLLESEKFNENDSTLGMEIKPMDIWPWTDPLDPNYLVPIPDELVYTYSISYYSVQKILETPEYFNFPFGPVNNGCGPTTAAMLTSFYDRHALPNLVPGTLPLHHYENTLAVDNHVIQMAGYLQTCNNMEGDLTNDGNCTGTNYRNAISGLDRYFNDRGYSSYDAYYSTDLTGYSICILNGNPVYLRLNTTPGHAVLGIGQVSSYGSTPQLIVRYNWESRSGEFHVSKDLFNGFIFMSRG
jgi:hypothetical protein